MNWPRTGFSSPFSTEKTAPLSVTQVAGAGRVNSSVSALKPEG
jgi:hypothetical protein